MKRLSAASAFVRLPRLMANCVRSLRDKAPAEPEAAPRKRRVLLVDDEAALTKLCKLMLEQDDSFIVEEEQLGSRAVETARRFQPDVIFIDLSLPDKHGRRVAEELQDEPGLRDVPIIFWSGSFLKEHGSHAGRPALPKPFSHEELSRLAANPAHR